MFGKNKSRPIVVGTDKLQVHKVFSTIQGEGPWSGYPAVFIRLSGCNLRCFFCDTKWDDDKDKLYSAEEVVSMVKVEHERTATNHSIKRVVLTGGEPARQDCAKLLDLLNNEGYLVQIETAGTYYPDWFFQLDCIVVSPKTAHVHKLFFHDSSNTELTHWKYVLRAGETSTVDGLPNACTQELDPSIIEGLVPDSAYSKIPRIKALTVLNDKFGSPARPVGFQGTNIWVSPCNEYDDYKNRANCLEVAESCMKFGYRAQVQLQNYLQVP